MPHPDNSQPDFKAAKEFLELLGKNGSTRCRAIPHSSTPAEVKKRMRVHCFQYDEQAILDFQRRGFSIYVVINEGGDKAKDITACIAYYAEFDVGTEGDQWHTVNNSGLPSPSMVVRTGGKSLHFYWLLSTPVKNTALWQGDMKRLAAHLGSDKSVNDPSRVMRLPGCLYMDGNQQPVGRSEVVHYSEDAHGFIQTYSREQIITPLPADPAPLLQQPSTPKPDVSADRTEQRALEQLQLIPPRTPGTNTREDYLRLLWGLAFIVGPERAGAAMAVHSPAWAAEEDLTAKAKEANGSITDGTFFEVAKSVWGITSPKSQSPQGQSSDTTSTTSNKEDFLVRATNTLEDLKKGIQSINKLSTPAARTAAQYSLRNELGLDKDAYKQLVQDLLEEQETPAPTSFEELMKLDTGVETSIDDLAAKGSLTLVAAEGHAGKTSLFYRMAEAISTGNNFASRFKTTQGSVLLYQVDESPTDAINKFRRMSIEPDPSRFLPRWNLSPSMIPELEQDIRTHSPVAVFADSLMRIFGGRGISLNDAEFGIWLYQLNGIASRYGTSFFLSHHLKKPENQKRTRVSKHDLFGTAFLYNGTSDCWGLYPSQVEGSRADQFCLEFLKARSGIQEIGTVFDLQGSVEDYSWELMGIQGQTESLEEKKLFADEVRELLKLKGGHWTAQQVADYFKVSNERARTTLIKLYERRLGIDRSRRINSHGNGRPMWAYFAK